MTTTKPSFVLDQENRTLKFVPAAVLNRALILMQLQKTARGQQWPHHQIRTAYQYEWTTIPVNVEHQEQWRLTPDGEEMVHCSSGVVQEIRQFAWIHE